jgi:hypothetical protein
MEMATQRLFGDGLKNIKNDSEGYDVLVANPIISLEDFKQHMNYNNHHSMNYLMKLILIDDIEVFIERQNNLLMLVVLWELFTKFDSFKRYIY